MLLKKIARPKAERFFLHVSATDKVGRTQSTSIEKNSELPAKNTYLQIYLHNWQIFCTFAEKIGDHTSPLSTNTCFLKQKNTKSTCYGQNDNLPIAPAYFR